MRAPPNSDDLVRRGLKFSQIRLIAALRDTGQIGAAARQVGMTQPAASRLLAQLDDMVGTPLYTRHPRGILLTEAGAILAAQASDTLKHIDRAHQRIAEIQGGTRGLVRIGSVTGASLELLLPVLRDLRDRFPDIEVATRIETSDRLAEALAGDDLDFYIGRIIESADHRNFTFDRIASEPISLLVSIDHPLAGRTRLTLADCLDYDWVMQPRGNLMRGTVDAHFRERNLPPPDHVVATTSTLFSLALVNDTKAIAPVARAVAEFFVARSALGSRLTTLAVGEDIRVSDFGIVARAGEDPSPATERVLALLRRRARAMIGLD